MKPEEMKPNNSLSHYRFGYYMAVTTACLTIITFVIAILTPPLSGPFCAGSCFGYPYTDITGRFPRDYYWMYWAIPLSFSYLIMMITLYQVIPQNKKLFCMIGVSLAIMASLLLASDYFIQLSVIQSSLLAGETEGIALLTQFNPHGIFIVLEEMGFFLMIASLFALFPIFENTCRLDRVLKWTAITGFFLACLSFLLVSLIHGIHREYRFEVIIISITWIELILMSIFLAKYFKYSKQLTDHAE